jgi:hypothetical protein
MVCKEALKRLRRYGMATVLVAVALMFAGCPLTYEVALGNWIIHLSGFPVYITHGLTLEEDGDAIPYESVSGYGVLPGTWTWATNGHNIWFTQNYDGNFYTYYGELLSETSAYGDTYEGSYQGNTGNAVGTWEAALDL